MTLPGGPAAKLGDRYEGWWTLSEFLRMLGGETEAIRIEDPSADKTEFVVTAGSSRELHQAKRSHPTGKWSLSALQSDGLLQAMGVQLAGNNDRFVFASGSDARELADLCAAARDAQSDVEFERNFLKAGSRKRGFDKLRQCWDCDPSTAYERLLRIEVHTIDEGELETKVRLGVQILFLSQPAVIVALLRTIVEDSVHRTWTRSALLQELEARGHPKRRVVSLQSALAAVEEATDRYLYGERPRLIHDMLIPRTATQTLLSAMEETATDSILTGKAGSGKSACVVELVDGLRALGLPALAFRLDRVPMASTPTTTELGDCLRLEESPVLVLKAAVEAAGCPGVLIVDQLDAASTMSGRSSGAFELVDQLIREVRGVRARSVIHTVVVCRAFDWQHDHRLRQLVPPGSQAQIDVAELSLDEVRAVLTAAGLDLALFRVRQLELLQLPQNLSLFIEADFDVSSEPTFATEKMLFDRYWDAKRRAVAEQAAAVPDEWLRVVEVLCDEMTASRQLSVARETLDRFSPDYVERMASEGVVTLDGRRYGFGHESFFDYCFARLFVSRPTSLVSFLTGSEQHLFQRAQIRQVLTYLRDADRVRYVHEMASLLSEERVRVHLKDLAFALLAEVPDPSEDEWTIWESWLAPTVTAAREGTPNSNLLSALAWRKFLGSKSWFEFADRRGVVESWLGSSSDGLTDLAMSWLHVHHRIYPDRAAALLEPYADQSDPWHVRLRGFMQWAEVHLSRRLFDLFLHLVDNGALDEARGPIAANSTFWDLLYQTARDRPDWIPEVLAHRLNRRLTIIQAAGEVPGRQDLLGYDPAITELMEKSAGPFPSLYVEYMLPVVLAISDATLIETVPPRRDGVWQHLIRSEHLRGEDAVLDGLAKALATLAHDETKDLGGTIADLRHRETHIANHLLLTLYTGGLERYADEAVALLCDQPWRFECGFSDNPYWCAMEGLRAVIRCCTPENRVRMEEVILGYYAPFERTRSGNRWKGHSQFSLLSAFPEALRSPRANLRFAELERKFGEPEGEPTPISADWIGPPIEKHGTDRMTDDQWLSAIAKYRTEFPAYSPGELKGGAYQMAQALALRVSEEPDRFARLSLKFSSDTNPMYLAQLLTALKDTSVETELKLQVCSKAFGEALGACGQAIADVLGSIEDQLPDATLEMLQWLAAEHEDPSREYWREDAPAGGKYHGGDISGFGINTTRGRAAIAIGDLIMRNATYIERLRPTLDRMVRDPSPAVLSCVAGTLRAVAYHHPARGLQLFRDMNFSEEGLLATRHVCAFIRDGVRSTFSDLRPVLERMLRSSEPKVCKAGSRLASLAFLADQNAADLVDEALHGRPCQRLGVAQVAAANIIFPEYRRWSKESLRLLFNDEDAEVRTAAASCFSELKDEDLDAYGDLIEAFCNSRAFDEDSFWILRLMEASSGRLPGMTCLVCEKFLDRFADEARDIRTGRAADTPTLVKLVFRTYQQHPNDEWTSRALALIDRLCLEGISDAGQQLDHFER